MTLLVRAARLLGDRSAGGRLLVQTTIPRHEVLQAVLLADPGRLFEPELERRRALRFPPAAALARVTGAGAPEYVGALARLSSPGSIGDATSLSAAGDDRASPSGPGRTGIAPTDSALIEVSGAEASGYLVRAHDWTALGAALTATARPPKSRLRIEVDPPRL
jgi:primosomal protein N' (replication factor Y)